MIQPVKMDNFVDLHANMTMSIDFTRMCVDIILVRNTQANLWEIINIAIKLFGVQCSVLSISSH